MKKLGVLLLLAWVSCALVFVVKLVLDYKKQAVGEAPVIVAAAASAQPEELPWMPVEHLVSVSGEWADACGPGRLSPGPCGATLSVWSKKDYQERGREYDSSYPWSLQLYLPETKATVMCGFYQDLTAVPSDAKMTEAWRTGFCNTEIAAGQAGNGPALSPRADRVVLLFQSTVGGINTALLRARVGYLKEVTLARVRK